jgi:hypothetical protein
VTDRQDHIWFYGCIGQILGHVLINCRGEDQPYSVLSRMGVPVLRSIDGGFLPTDAQPGQIYRTILPGWTIVSMIDNSVDHRPGSNANFLIKGEHTLSEALAFARLAFPEIAERLNLHTHPGA